MRQVLRPSTFVPSGLIVDKVDQAGEAMTVTVRSSTPTSPCPGCRTPSKRVLSRHRRYLSDLPWAGKSVQLVLLARRFYCDAVLCGRRIFTECFATEPARENDPNATLHHARRSPAHFCTGPLKIALCGLRAATSVPIERRRRSIMPKTPRPVNMRAHVEGSGAADTGAADISVTCNVSPPFG